MTQPPQTPEPDNESADFALTRFSEYPQHICAMAADCRRHLNIFSQDFDHLILDNIEVVSSLRSFAVDNSRHASIRILVQRPENAIQQGHKLVELARRLTSIIEIRRPASQHAAVANGFLTFDNSRYLFRELGDRPDGVGSYDDSLRTIELTRLFDEIWALATPEPEFRRLGL